MADVADDLDEMTTVPTIEADLDTLRNAWQKPLDW
jgi:hypothetical protein